MKSKPLRALLIEAISELRSSQRAFVTSPRQEIELLLRLVLNLSSVELLLQLDTRRLNESELSSFFNLLQRRVDGEPLAYILGHQDFYKSNFFVNPSVLIPRPETELLVEKVIDHIDHGVIGHLSQKVNDESSFFQFIDMGTGSGCIGLSILKELCLRYPQKSSQFQGLLIDSSPEALSVAQENAKRLGFHFRSDQTDQTDQSDQTNQSDQLEQSDQADQFDQTTRTSHVDQVRFLCSTVESWIPDSNNFIGLIVGNPPYISWDSHQVESSVTKYEPHIALFSDSNGFAHIERWSRKVKECFDCHTPVNSTFPLCVAFEIGYNQGSRIESLWRELGFKDISIEKDLQQCDRFAFGFYY